MELRNKEIENLLARDLSGGAHSQDILLVVFFTANEIKQICFPWVAYFPSALASRYCFGGRVSVYYEVAHKVLPRNPPSD